MATTKKHFERAAAFIKRTHTADPGPMAEEQAEAAFAVCVDLFRSDNPRFDVERFRLACGLRVTSGQPAAPIPAPRGAWTCSACGHVNTEVVCVCGRSLHIERMRGLEEQRTRGLELLAKVKERLVTLGDDAMDAAMAAVCASRQVGHSHGYDSDAEYHHATASKWMAEQAKELAVDLAVALHLVRGVPGEAKDRRSP